MTVVSVQPNASAATNWTVVGAASIHAALADASDASYADATLGGSASPLVLDFASPSLPADSRVAEVRIRARARQPAGGANDLRGSLQLNGAIGISTQSVLQVPGTAWTTGVVIARSTKLDGTRWTEAELAGLQVRLHPGIQGGLEVADVDAEIEYEGEPTTSSVEVTTVASPVIAWEFNDPDDGADPSERARVIIVADGILDTDSNAAGTAGFDPLTASATVYDSGDLIGNLRSHSTGASLGGGDYYAYVRAAKVWTVDSETWWSPWAASSLFSVIEANTRPPAINGVSFSSSPDTPGHATATVRQMGNILRLDTSRECRMTALANSTVTNDSTADPLIGSVHSIFTPTSAGVATAELFLPNAVQAFANPFVAGQSITASLWVRHTTPAQFKFFTLNLTINEIGGGTLATVAGSVTAVETEWRQVDVTTTLPALVGSSGWEFELGVQVSSSNGIDFYLDGPAIHPGTDPAWSPGIGFIDLSTDWVCELQRSDDEGLSWTKVPGFTTFDFAHNQLETITDKGPTPRGRALYRVRTRPEPAGSDADGLDSDWSAAFTLVAGPPLNRWDLWDLGTDTQITLSARRHPRTRADRHHTFEPIGRSEGITHSETGRGEMGALTVRTYTAADHAALLAMLTSGRTLRLRDHLGGAWWVRVNRAPTVEQVRARPDDPDWSTAYFHDVSFSWREAGAPA